MFPKINPTNTQAWLLLKRHYDEEMQSTARMLAWWWKSQPVFNPYLFAVNAAVDANRSQYAALKQEMDGIQEKLAKLSRAAERRAA